MDSSIKQAFQKVKQDIAYLNNFLIKHNKDNLIINERLNKMYEILNILNNYNQSISNKLQETEQRILLLTEKLEELTKNTFKVNYDNNPTHNNENPTQTTPNPTDNYPIKPLKEENIGISTGNEGVPTDKPTNQQTNQQTQNMHENNAKTNENSFKNAIDVLNSLDTIKRDIRLKFKRLTEQEINVFSIMYSIEEKMGYSDYKLISEKLGLSESSIRDYVGKLLKKGIPLEKNKLNNKQVQLKISEDLKKIAPLSTILQLRDL